ncbi:MAG: sodium:calcium antiporter [Actinomycetes bacterium]
MIGLLLLAGAAVLLIGGAELFVENAAAAANRMGVTVIAVGILLAGAEPEELLTAVIAAVQDRPGLAAGDAIGANVTMLTACLGLAALVRPLHLGRRVRQYAGLSAVAGVLALLTLLGGHVGRLEGGLLLAAYVVLVALVWWREREPPTIGELAELQGEEDGEPRRERSPSLGLLLALVGVALMLVGGDLAVRGAEQVVDAFGRADSAIGLTVLALATSAELFALVLTAARHDVPEIAVAGVVGSAAYNATATLGAAALARPLAVEGITASAVAAAALPLVVLLLAPGGRLGRLAGGALAAAYAGYVLLVLR